MPLSIAHGLFTWRDGRVALEACLRSTAGIVDHVIIADGLIDGVPDNGQPWVSELGWMVDADYLPARVPISTHGPHRGTVPWASLSDACNYLLGTAKQLGADWLLFVDGDQELHSGENLSIWLNSCAGDAFPIRRPERAGNMFCPWQLIRVSAFNRYLSGCYILEHHEQGPVSLVPEGPIVTLPPWPDIPWISHHPERRPPDRQSHRLGELEAKLEPPPVDIPMLRSLRSFM
jgi:hypothetical protein